MSRTDLVVVQAHLYCHSESHFSPERVEVSRFDFEMLAPGVNLGDCRVQVDSFSRRKQLTATPRRAPGVVLGHKDVNGIPSRPAILTGSTLGIGAAREGLRQLGQHIRESLLYFLL